VNRPSWQPITGPKLIGFGLGSGLFFLVLAVSETGFVFLLDHANLLFHEAGHPIVGLFSRRLEPYGGTIGQLAFPMVLAIHFWRTGRPLSLAAAGLWFFENWLNIARYMADARALELPLVGGGNHDWNTLFSRWGVLQHDVTLATVLQVNAWLGMIGVCVWVFWRYWQDRQRMTGTALFDHEPVFEVNS
jgi:hypothetical protein